MIKAFSRVANTAYVISLGAKSAADLGGALLLFLLVCWLTYAFIEAPLFLIIPALLAVKCASLVIRALQPFASQQAKSDPAASLLGQRRTWQAEQQRREATAEFRRRRKHPSGYRS
jgi:1,4-dihydroxy-2-naphthoate octaprenyltransferase